MSFSSSLRPHARWARFLVCRLWSRRLTEPPRPCVGDTVSCEGGGFSERSPSLALPPEEQLEISLSLPPNLRPHARWAQFPVCRLWSRRLTEPPRPANMPRPFEATHSSKPPLKGEVSAVGGRRGSVPPRRMVAAALSAAVTSHKLIGDTPHSQAEPPMKYRTKPNASRSSGVGGLGGEGLLSEKPPLPPASPPQSLFGWGSGGGGFSLEKLPPPESPQHLPYLFVKDQIGASVHGGRVAVDEDEMSAAEIAQKTWAGYTVRLVPATISVSA